MPTTKTITVTEYAPWELAYDRQLAYDRARRAYLNLPAAPTPEHPDPDLLELTRQERASVAAYALLDYTLEARNAICKDVRELINSPDRLPVVPGLQANVVTLRDALDILANGAPEYAEKLMGFVADLSDEMMEAENEAYLAA